jgi:hypothetical protein
VLNQKAKEITLKQNLKVGCLHSHLWVIDSENMHGIATEPQVRNPKV